MTIGYWIAVVLVALGVALGAWAYWQARGVSYEEGAGAVVIMFFAVGLVLLGGVVAGATKLVHWWPW